MRAYQVGRHCNYLKATIMDSLECVSIDTSLDDEIDFLQFATSDPNVHLVLPRANLSGPVFASVQEWPSLREQEEYVLLWNSRCSNPLCWEVRLPFQNLRAFPPIGKQTKHEFLTTHATFRQMPITEEQFASGRLHSSLSPVIEVSKGGYLVVTAEFIGMLRWDLWLVWDTIHSVWAHESRDLEKLYDARFEQARESVRWQERQFEWIYSHWWNKINRHPSWSYRSKDMGTPITWPIRLFRRQCRAYLHRLGIAG